MKRSNDRILTTHAGSLPRPDELIELSPLRAGGSADAFNTRLRGAVRDVVRMQREAGIDVVNDGEFGKAMRGSVDYGPWSSYANVRIGGWELAADQTPAVALRRERRLLPNVYAEISTSNAANPAPVLMFTGPITYRGQAAVKSDIENLKAAVTGAGLEDAFITSVAPGSFARRQNRYYKTEEEYLFALGDALREEYEAIVAAGFVLQIDDPGLSENWDTFDPEPTVEEYLRYVRVRVEALNHALANIAEDRVRYHICWGSWHGPHTNDLPLEHIVDLLLEVRAQAYSVEAGNVRHEHEWRVWRDTKLPAGKILIPGVVSHATNVVEHPQVVSDRIVRYARAVGRENVIAGTDCGLGGRIHPEIAWLKLKMLAEGAALATKELWG